MSKNRFVYVSPNTVKDQIAAAQERSGVSVVQFAHRAGLKYSTLAAWVGRYRRSKPPSQTQSVRLREAVVDPTQGGAAGSYCFCYQW